MSTKTAAAHALARAVTHPSAEMIPPDQLDRRVAHRVAAAVRDAYQNENGDFLCRTPPSTSSFVLPPGRA